MIRTLALCLTAALTVPSLAAAQTVLGVTLGEPIPEGLPAPVGTQIQAPFSFTLFGEQEGVSMSVISDAETGEVLFIELRPAVAGSVATPLEGLTFRQTTRADLHEQFGSEGVVFADVGRTRPVDQIAAFFTNYEVADSDTVISFASILPIAVSSEDTADTALLDSVIIANGQYLDQVWGVNRGRLPGYSQIENPFPAN